MPLSNGVQRTIFTLVATPVFVALLWAGGYWRFGLLSFVLGASMWEFARILRIKFPEVGLAPETWLPTAACIIAWMSPWGPLAGYGNYRGFGWFLVLLWAMIFAFRKLSREQAFLWIALVAAGLGYIAGWGTSFFALSHGPRGWAPLAPALMAFASCWIGDTAAYLVGRAIGRHKLCPELSPAKTIEGAIAGLLAPAAFGWWWGTEFLHLAPWVATLLGAALGLAGIVGDLLESVFKRWAGVKDSSRLLPGHGGMLDRMDSGYMAAPLLQFALVALASR
jgi:phosphatidate cytidylyltransferase